MKKNKNEEVHKFWDWVSSENVDGERTLYLDGIIAEDSWWDDEVTPREFEKELKAGSGPVTVWINSYGGDVFAAARIYNMLREYKGKVTVKIDGIAASAASVIAMAGDEVLMSPVATMMIHNPWTYAAGDARDFERVQRELDSVKQTIVNAYEIKTGLSREEISALMDDETYFDAKYAIEKKFADGILQRRPIEEESPQRGTRNSTAHKFGNRTAVAVLFNKLRKAPEDEPQSPEEPEGEPARVKVVDLRSELEEIKTIF